MMFTVRRGTSSRRMIWVAASGSVGDTTAPRANAAAHGIPSTSSWATNATAHMVNSTSPIELTRIGRASLRSARRSAKKAAE